MIGSAKITYTNDNVCQLVRKDLVDKFGNRELANYNLYLPGVIRSKAVVTEFPNPEIKVTSIEQQLLDMGVLPKPSVARQDSSVYASQIGAGANLMYSFDSDSHTLKVDGGPVQYTDLDDGNGYAHWYAIIVGIPVGMQFNENDIISYTANGVPKSYVLTDSDIEANEITFVADAKYTSFDLAICWSENNAVEKISVVCNAALAETAIKKIPVFPTQPKFEFIYPEDYAVDSSVQVDVDLDCGKG